MPTEIPINNMPDVNDVNLVENDGDITGATNEAQGNVSFPVQNSIPLPTPRNYIKIIAQIIITPIQLAFLAAARILLGKSRYDAYLARQDVKNENKREVSVMKRVGKVFSNELQNEIQKSLNEQGLHNVVVDVSPVNIGSHKNHFKVSVKDTQNNTNVDFYVTRNGQYLLPKFAGNKGLEKKAELDAKIAQKIDNNKWIWKRTLNKQMNSNDKMSLLQSAISVLPEAFTNASNELFVQIQREQKSQEDREPTDTKEQGDETKKPAPPEVSLYEKLQEWIKQGVQEEFPDAENIVIQPSSTVDGYKDCYEVSMMIGEKTYSLFLDANGEIQNKDKDMGRTSTGDEKSGFTFTADKDKYDKVMKLHGIVKKQLEDMCNTYPISNNDCAILKEYLQNAFPGTNIEICASKSPFCPASPEVTITSSANKTLVKGYVINDGTQIISQLQLSSPADKEEYIKAALENKFPKDEFQVKISKESKTLYIKNKEGTCTEFHFKKDYQIYPKEDLAKHDKENAAKYQDYLKLARDGVNQHNTDEKNFGNESFNKRFNDVVKATKAMVDMNYEVNRNTQNIHDEQHSIFIQPIFKDEEVSGYAMSIDGKIETSFDKFGNVDKAPEFDNDDIQSLSEVYQTAQDVMHLKLLEKVECYPDIQAVESALSSTSASIISYMGLNFKYEKHTVEKENKQHEIVTINVSDIHKKDSMEKEFAISLSQFSEGNAAKAVSETMYQVAKDYNSALITDKINTTQTSYYDRSVDWPEAVSKFRYEPEDEECKKEWGNAATDALQIYHALDTETRNELM